MSSRQTQDIEQSYGIDGSTNAWPMNPGDPYSQQRDQHQHIRDNASSTVNFTDSYAAEVSLMSGDTFGQGVHRVSVNFNASTYGGRAFSQSEYLPPAHPPPFPPLHQPPSIDNSSLIQQYETGRQWVQPPTATVPDFTGPNAGTLHYNQPLPHAEQFPPQYPSLLHPLPGTNIIQPPWSHPAPPPSGASNATHYQSSWTNNWQRDTSAPNQYTNASLPEASYNPNTFNPARHAPMHALTRPHPPPNPVQQMWPAYQPSPIPPMSDVTVHGHNTHGRSEFEVPPELIVSSQAEYQSRPSASGPIRKSHTSVRKSRAQPLKKRKERRTKKYTLEDEKRCGCGYVTQDDPYRPLPIPQNVPPPGDKNPDNPAAYWCEVCKTTYGKGRKSHHDHIFRDPGHRLALGMQLFKRHLCHECHEKWFLRKDERDVHAGTCRGDRIYRGKTAPVPPVVYPTDYLAAAAPVASDRLLTDGTTVINADVAAPIEASQNAFASGSSTPMFDPPPTPPVAPTSSRRIGRPRAAPRGPASASRTQMGCSMVPVPGAVSSAQPSATDTMTIGPGIVGDFSTPADAYNPTSSLPTAPSQPMANSYRSSLMPPDHFAHHMGASPSSIGANLPPVTTFPFSPDPSASNAMVSGPAVPSNSFLVPADLYSASLPPRRAPHSNQTATSSQHPVRLLGDRGQASAAHESTRTSTSNPSNATTRSSMPPLATLRSNFVSPAGAFQPSNTSTRPHSAPIPRTRSGGLLRPTAHLTIGGASTTTSASTSTSSTPAPITPAQEMPHTFPQAVAGIFAHNSTHQWLFDDDTDVAVPWDSDAHKSSDELHDEPDWDAYLNFGQ